MLIAVGLCVADDVHRIAVRPVGRQYLIQTGNGGIRQTGHDKSQVGCAIGGHHAGPTAVGDNRQTVSRRMKTAGQGLGGREQLRHRLYPHHAGAAHGGVERIVRADQ